MFWLFDKENPNFFG